VSGMIVLYLRRHHVAFVALFIALGGSAYAATALPRDSVGATQLKNNAVTSAKVKNGSLVSADFHAGNLPRGPAGQAGPAGAPGAPGAPGVRGPSDAYASSYSDMAIAAGTAPFELATESLPNGGFVTYANFIAESGSSVTTGVRDLSCGLYVGGGSGTIIAGNAVDFAQETLSPGDQRTVSLTAPIILASPGPLTLDCKQSGQTGAGLTIKDIDIGAIQIAAIH
jgi:hypothetical protein